MNNIGLKTLKNGMRLVSVDMEGLESVTVLSMVAVGSRYEDPKLAGISHFLEHLPFKGTANYPTSMDLAVAIDGVGGKHNAFTGKEYTGYWVKVGADKLPLALDVVSDLMLTAKLDQSDIDKERGVIIEEINMYEDQPQAKIGDLYEELVYVGSPLSLPVIGTKETVSNLERSDFLAHWDAWYDPSHVVIGVVGKLSATSDQLQDLVEKYFSKGEQRRGGGAHVDYVTTQTKPQLKVFKKETEQAHFHLGFPAMSRYDGRRHALSLLSTIMGGNSSSRLFNEIREKRGLAYYAYASADLNRDLGSFYAFEGVSLKQASEAVKVTIAEFNKVRDLGVSELEIARAKEYIVGKLQLDLEDSSRMADLMVEKALFENEVETIEQILAKYQAVTLDEVNQVAKDVIDMQRLNLAIIGPYEEKEFEFVLR